MSTPADTTVTAPQPDPVEAARAEASPAEGRHPTELFKYSEFVHVGPAAEECEEATTGKCTNTMHFHAWCRLPNQFQHQSITEKATAAKARKIRQYRDPESDPSVILDGELETIEFDTGAEAARHTYIEELVYADFMQDYFNTMQEMKTEVNEDDPDEPGPWATMDEDRERLRALEATPEEERDATEYEELRKHTQAFDTEVERRVKEDKQAPVREALQNKSIDELRAMVRDGRVQRIAAQDYQKTYAIWEQYIGTLKPQPQGMPAGKPGVAQERYFANVEALKAAAPEVVAALDEVFTEMDGEFGKTLMSGAMGKG